MRGLVLAGGHGTRLRPLTHTGPKQLIPIANKPNILYCIQDLVDAGITEIGVILGNNMPEKVRELLGDGSKHGCRITYIVQGAPRGIAHAVLCAKEFMGREPFVVYLGDNLLKGGIKHLVEDFQVSRPESTIALCKVPNPQQFGVAEIDADGNVLRCVEKPKEPRSDLAIVGIYLFRDSVFQVIDGLKPSWRNELEITDAIAGLVERKKIVKAHIIKGWWKDTGKPEDILHANHLVLEDLRPRAEGSVHASAQLKGRVSIGKASVVKEGCVIRGPVIIGDECEIGPSTHIGPYTAIGSRCKIVGADIEDSILMEGCVVETPAKIVSSLVGANSRIASAERLLPRGVRLVLGEASDVRL